MRLVKVFPIIFSTLLFTAHLLRLYGYVPPILLMMLCFSLVLEKRWILRFWQALLTIFSLLWIIITINLVLDRIEKNMPWERLLLIMGALILINLLSLLWTNSASLKKIYNQ